MKREEEKTTHTNHRALKNQTHIVRWEKKQEILVSYLWKISETELQIWGTIHVLDN